MSTGALVYTCMVSSGNIIVRIYSISGVCVRSKRIQVWDIVVTFSNISTTYFVNGLATSQSILLLNHLELIVNQVGFHIFPYLGFHGEIWNLVQVCLVTPSIALNDFNKLKKNTMLRCWNDRLTKQDLPARDGPPIRNEQGFSNGHLLLPWQQKLTLHTVMNTIPASIPIYIYTPMHIHIHTNIFTYIHTYTLTYYDNHKWVS